MNDFTLYDYVLPAKLIAQKPAHPKDAAKLLVFNTKEDTISFDTFSHLDKYLTKESLLVFNNTKVVPCRVFLQKDTGGKVEVFFLLNEWKQTPEIPVLVDREVIPGQTLSIAKYSFLIRSVQKNEVQLMPQFPIQQLNIFFEIHGKMPVPPYIKKTPLTEEQIRQQYQPLFAKHQGSVAAPTASLHFTDTLLQRLHNKGIQSTEITLHVGRGTFQGVTQQQIKEKKLHTEWMEINKETVKQIQEAKQQKKMVIAVGTTVCRTLEFVGQSSPLKPYQGDANLFIYPPYEFKIVDALITNFHLPKTSLMMLVEAFLQQKKAKRHLIDLYKIAIEKQYRFYSFGDGMLIL